jgi:exodeoxyribonuclease V alpha subunit
VKDPDLLALDFSRFVQHLAAGGPPSLVLAAYLASHSTSRGSVCADLSCVTDELPGEPPPLEQWLADLSACPEAVTLEPDSTGPRPLVLRGTRLYLHRYWEYERRVVRRVGELAGAPAAGVDREALRSPFRTLFPDLSPGNGEDRFATAAWIAATRRLAIVTGGPGTGKTSLAARLLAFLAAAQGRVRIRAALAAPTGKAAQRLSESITRQLKKDHNHIDEDLRLCVPTEAVTLHRLLGWSPFLRRWKRGEDNPLEEDVVVVDEASMADLPMMSRLLAALKPGSRLLLLGDRDQLASVEAGFVLGDLCGAGLDGARSPALAGELARLGIPGVASRTDTPALSDAVVVLEKGRRFPEGSGIALVARLINQGGDEKTAREALDLLRGGAAADLAWTPLPPPWWMGDRIGRAALQVCIPLLRAAGEGKDIEAAFSGLNAFRILCALRQGPYGAEGVNRAVEGMVRRKLGVSALERDYPGRPVMVTANDYGRKLFNGDVGLMAPDPSEGGRLKAWFPGGEDEVSGKMCFRAFLPAQLPPHETAYAMTVHKSQGSEFKGILLVLPPHDNAILTRELIYTAVTRAESRVEVWGSGKVFLAALARRTQRSSGLREALWGK